MDKREMEERLELAEYLLEEFEGLTHKSKILFFAYFFNEYVEDSTIAYILSSGQFDYSECQSPIEEIFAVAYDLKLSLVGFPECEVLRLKPQEKIVVNNKTYYADFLLDVSSDNFFVCDHDYKLVIECDGHEFHEKTKEQVEKRNNRDMDLKSAGYDVLHFSGSQIFKNPIECANKVFDYINSKVGAIRNIYGDL